jgi:colanic acid/amylovoran biosynthesis glycosyltransferase
VYFDSFMKIILFDGSYATTAFIRRLLAGLVKAGIEVSVMGFNEANPHPVAGVKYRPLGSNQSKRRLLQTSWYYAWQKFTWASFKNTLKHSLRGNRQALQQQNLAFVLENDQPDVLHVQWPSLLPWLEPYREQRQFKLVLSQRGYHINVRPFVNPENFAYLKEWYPQLDGIHSVSRAIRQVGAQIGRPHTGVEAVVYTGLALNDFTFSEKRINSETLELISVGRSHWKKDYPMALRACKLLKERGLSFHYQIIGASGDEECLYLRQAFGLEEQVSLLPRVPIEEVKSAVQAADFMLLPSIEEGLANVAVEAMALGTPVISTRCGGMQELICHEENGWLVPSRNALALANQIEQVTQLNKSTYAQVAKAARNKVEKQHQEQQMVQGMLALYQDLL